MNLPCGHVAIRLNSTNAQPMNRWTWIHWEKHTKNRDNHWMIKGDETLDETTEQQGETWMERRWISRGDKWISAVSPGFFGHLRCDLREVPHFDISFMDSSWWKSPQTMDDLGVPPWLMKPLDVAMTCIAWSSRRRWNWVSQLMVSFVTRSWRQTKGDVAGRCWLGFA